MRAKVIVPLVLTLLLASAVSCFGLPYTFAPLDPDLADLDHLYYYAWEINWNIPNGQYIVGAELTISNIWDWKVEPDDFLYYHLLDSPPVFAGPGVDYVAFPDAQSGGDNWLTREGPPENLVGYRLDTWFDPLGGAATGYNLVYTFNAADLTALTAYLLDGNFGFGFDPDCHYNNDGISLVIRTAPVPEPGTLILLGSGLVGLATLRRRRRAG